MSTSSVKEFNYILSVEPPHFIYFETDSCKPYFCYMSVLYWPRQKTFDFPLPLWSIIQGSESAILQKSGSIKYDHAGRWVNCNNYQNSS